METPITRYVFVHTGLRPGPALEAVRRALGTSDDSTTLPTIDEVHVTRLGRATAVVACVRMQRADLARITARLERMSGAEVSVTEPPSAGGTLLELLVVSTDDTDVVRNLAAAIRPLADIVDIAAISSGAPMSGSPHFVARFRIAPITDAASQRLVRILESLSDEAGWDWSIEPVDART